MSEPTEAKTIGFTPIYCSDNAMFHVSAGVPVSVALAQASDFFFWLKRSQKTPLTKKTPTVMLGPRII